MSIWGVVIVTIVVFALVVAGILIWARRQVRAQQARETGEMTRQAYLNLAAHAAGDASGRALVRLLNALDTAPIDCPVTVQWLRHIPVGKPTGMLVKITWDGNEWRRVMDWDAFREQLNAAAAQEPACGERVKQLLAELEARPE